jgi:hypothetical protein
MHHRFCFFCPGRHYKENFKKGIVEGNSKLFKLYNRKIRGEGSTAEYHCTSEVTKASISQWFTHAGVVQSTAAIGQRVLILLRTWLEYRKDPVRHFNAVYEVRICVPP